MFDVSNFHVSRRIEAGRKDPCLSAVVLENLFRTLATELDE